jgi:hypothetical protein
LIKPSVIPAKAGIQSVFSGIIVGAIRLLAPTGEPHLVLSCEVKQQKTRQRAGFFAQTSSGLK